MLSMFPPIPGVHAEAQPQPDKYGAGYAATRSDAAPRQYASMPAEISSKEMSTGAFPL